MSKEVQTFTSFLKEKGEALKQQIAAAIPKHMNAERMLRVITTEVRRVPELNECTLQSILGSIMQASQLGLEVGSVIGHGYLIPFNTKIKGSSKYQKECQFIIGYRGMIDIARRSGKVKSISANCVYENDFFDFEYGLDEKCRHIPCRSDRGDLIGAYAIANLTDGGYQFEVMFKSDIDKIRAKSKSGGSEYSPWSTHYDEMCRKTLIRRLFKYLPISIELYENVVNSEIREMKDVAGNILGGYSVEDPLIPLTKTDILAQKLSEQKTEEETPEEKEKDFYAEEKPQT